MKGSFSIPAINLYFKDTYTLVPLEEFLRNYGNDILQNPVVADQMKAGRLEIISSKKARELLRKKRTDEAEQRAKENAVLVDGTVDQHLEDYTGVGAMDAIPIDLNKGHTGKRPRVREGLGSNEGSLLPDMM